MKLKLLPALFLLLVLSLFACESTKPSESEEPDEPATPDEPDSSMAPYDGWSQFTDLKQGYSIWYPTELTASIAGPDADLYSLTLEHEFPFTHVDYCNLKEESTLDEFQDFSVKIGLFEGTLEEAKAAQVSYTDLFETFEDSEAKEFYAANSSVEECGVFYYVLPMDETHYLIAEQKLIAFPWDPSEDGGPLADEILSHPETILNADEEESFPHSTPGTDILFKIFETLTLP